MEVAHNKLIDLHLHLNHFTDSELSQLGSHPDFPNFLLNSNHSISEYNRSCELKKRFTGIENSIGIHPQIADPDCPEIMELLDFMYGAKEILAIGEIGYDIYPTNPSFEKQQKLFRLQLELAEKRSLPLILHCRQGFEPLADELERYRGKLKFAFHGYSGGFKYLDRFIKLGAFFSFGTAITYPTATRLKRIAAIVPKDKILSESDSPFNLTRKANPEIEKNTPLSVANTVKILADSRGVTYAEQIDQIYQNRIKMFLQ